MTFQTAPICPYCGTEYKLDPMEIENIRNIELKRVEEEKEARRQKRLKTIEQKVASYTSPKQCQNWVEITQFCKSKGYKPRLRIYSC